MRTDLIAETGMIDIKTLRDGYDIMVRHGDDPSLIRMHIRTLNTVDLPGLMELQSDVHSGMEDKEQFVFTSLEECADSVINDICIGMFKENRLIAASILVVNRASDRNIGAKMGYDPLQSATLDSMFISHEFRGMGLHNYMIGLRLELADELGAKYAFATVSPKNVYSLKNLKDSGFCCIYRGLMYGSFYRFVMMKKLKLQGT